MRVQIVTLTVGVRAKEGKGGGGGEKKNTLFSLPAPSPLPLTRPTSSSIREVSTWYFREQIARSKKTPALQAISEPHECHALLQSILLRLRSYILYDKQRSSRPTLQERKSERVFLVLLLVVFATMCQGDHFL